MFAIRFLKQLIQSLYESQISLLVAICSFLLLAGVTSAKLTIRNAHIAELQQALATSERSIAELQQKLATSNRSARLLRHYLVSSEIEPGDRETRRFIAAILDIPEDPAAPKPDRAHIHLGQSDPMPDLLQR